MTRRHKLLTSPNAVFREGTRRLNFGTSVDEQRRGVELLKCAADLGHIRAHLWLGAAFDYGLGVKPHRLKAFRHYLIAAEAGNANGQYHVGVFYHEGRGVPTSYTKAVAWLRKAVIQGDAEAMYLLGQCFRYGRGVRRDLTKGLVWYTMLLIEACWKLSSHSACASAKVKGWRKIVGRRSYGICEPRSGAMKTQPTT